MTALWSVVHGYAHLAIAGKLAPPLPTGDPLPGGCLPARPEEQVEALRPVLTVVLNGLFPA